MRSTIISAGLANSREVHALEQVATSLKMRLRQASVNMVCNDPKSLWMTEPTRRGQVNAGDMLVDPARVRVLRGFRKVEFFDGSRNMIRNISRKRGFAR